jgi:hypothetical protein
MNGQTSKAMSEATINQPSTRRAAEKFSRDAKRYTKRVTKSAATARRELVKLGIHTPSGKLAKKYK